MNKDEAYKIVEKSHGHVVASKVRYYFNPELYIPVTVGIVDTSTTIIQFGFWWRDTEEGYEYWLNQLSRTNEDS